MNEETLNALLIAPHNDDAELFAAYTCIRQKPLILVVTDGYIQWNRGDRITAEQRRLESVAAARVTGCPVVFGGIPDDRLNREALVQLFRRFANFDIVYAPAVQGGNEQHDLVGTVAAQMFTPIKYTTYTRTELYTKGDIEIAPNELEIELKNKALDCYQSQINLGATAPHFWAVRGKSEWLVP